MLCSAAHVFSGNQLTVTRLALISCLCIAYNFSLYFAKKGRFQAAVVGHEGRLWAVGGCESWSPLNSSEIYDPSTDSWSIGPSLNTPRRGCGLAVFKGIL